MAVQRVASCVVALLAVVAMLVAPATDARAQATGTVNVSVDFPSLVILYYFSDIDVTITEPVLASYLTDGAGDAINESSVAVSASHTSPATLFDDFDAAMSPTPLVNSISDVFVPLQNAWAVRSIGRPGGTNTQVDIQSVTPSLTGSNGGAMNLDGVTLRPSGGVGIGSATVSFLPAGLLNPQMGDIVLELDITGATTEGSYTGASFILRAQNL